MAIKKLIEDAKQLVKFLKKLDKDLEEGKERTSTMDDIPMFARKAQNLSNELQQMKGGYYRGRSSSVSSISGQVLGELNVK